VPTLLHSLVGIALLGSACHPARGESTTAPDGTGVSHGKLEVAGQVREYRLYVPASVRESGKRAPLLFAFHGFRIDNMDRMAAYTQLEATAEKHGFIIVFPNGRETRWRLRFEGNEDIAFFDALFKHLKATLPVDDRRIYLTGMSNGAYFINLLASQRSTVIAAIAPHSGGLGLLARRGIHAERKYPVLIIHGADDDLVPPSQGRQCRDAYQNEGHEVTYREIAGLRHLWGNPAEINETMWRFFDGHRAPR
jgi:polyhydroxybutyrate depolymerase